MSTPWSTHNADGLELANVGRWLAAADAFERAANALDQDEENGTITPLAKDDVSARLLLNLGQCHFHAGNLADARRFAERSCGLRVALYGEDALVVARTRGDLAVILAASGHFDEALSLLERAVAAVERKRGAESAHLLPLLTNAARLLARTDPDRARPYIDRLGALSFARRQSIKAEIFPPSAIPAHSFAPDSGFPSGDDHYLRAAIAETVDLLRVTPTGSSVSRSLVDAVAGDDTVGLGSASVDVGPEMHDADATLPDNRATLPDNRAALPDEPLTVSDDSFALPHDDTVLPNEVIVSADALNPLPVPQPGDGDASIAVAWEYEEPLPAQPAASANAKGANAHPANAPDANADIDDSLFDLVEPPPPTLSVIPAVPSAAAKAAENALGFEVQYGIPAQLHESMENPTTPLPEGAAEPTPADGTRGVSARGLRSEARPEIRAVGGVRSGRAQLVAMDRVLVVVKYAGAFGAGVGAYLLFNYIRNLAN